MKTVIVEEILRFQKSLGLPDTKFIGNQLGDASLWSHIKAGRKAPSEKFLLRVGNRYPALQPAITEYLFPGKEEGGNRGN